MKSYPRPNLILIGSQGSGKGTQAERLVTHHGYKLIATGDIFRDHLAKRDDLAKSVKRYILRGEFVPDEIVADVVRQQLATIDLVSPIVFDGFPRNRRQVTILEELFQSEKRTLPQVVYLKIPRGLVFERLINRHVCADCGVILSVLPNSVTKLICPACHSQNIIVRPDDRAETIEIRLNYFFEQTLPVIDFFAQTGRLIEINGDQTIDQVTTDVERALHFPITDHTSSKASETDEKVTHASNSPRS